MDNAFSCLNQIISPADFVLDMYANLLADGERLPGTILFVYTGSLRLSFTANVLYLGKLS